MPSTYTKYIDNLLESLYKTRKFLAEKEKNNIFNTLNYMHMIIKEILINNFLYV